MRVLRAADRRAMPWKNGGGVTWELAVHPAGASLDDFDWRISLAEVAADGPFSRFPGVDRVLTVIEGEGLELTVDGRATVLDAGSPPLAFAGEAAAAARLSAGPIRDLNLMVRRGVWTATAARGLAETWPVPADRDLLFALALNPVTVLSDGRPLALARLDAILVEKSDTAKLAFSGQARVLTAALRLASQSIG